jgi:ABC-2 type transport system permease protein
VDAAPAIGASTFDPSRAHRGGARLIWRSFRTAALLGWQMEANWTDPILFFIYSVAKPLAAALMLVFMLQVIGAGSDLAFRAFVVVGSALWSFVATGMTGLAQSVLDDRERYRMLKYMVISPNEFLVLLLGRGVARVAVGGVAAVITLAVGVAFLGVPFDPARVDLPLLLVSMAFGLTSVVAIGILMAGVIMQTRQDSWSYPEALAGAMFLLVGAVFPLTILPLPAQVVGLALPLTWWLAGVRLALFPDSVTSVGGQGSEFLAATGRMAPSPVEIVVALMLTGALVTLGALAVFRWSERRAKDRGLFDMTTGS